MLKKYCMTLKCLHNGNAANIGSLSEVKLINDSCIYKDISREILHVGEEVKFLMIIPLHTNFLTIPLFRSC